MLGTEEIFGPPPEFERFLLASVGKDRNGSAVTVLSALARLGLDPWDEASELAMMGREAACVRLALSLAKFRDVPALGPDHASVARDLTLLLPECPSPTSTSAAGLRLANGKLLWLAAIWVGLATVLVLVLVKFAGG